MKTKMKISIVITIVLVMIVSLGFSQVRGSGNVITQERDVSNFSAIRLTSFANLYIRQGDKSVTVKTDDNVMDLVETEVENGTLVIGIKGRGLRNVKTLDVFITIPDLNKIKNSGSGDITFKNTFKASDLYIGISGSGDLEANFDVKDLELKVSGSGDSEISGVTGNFKVSISGSGDLEAENLRLTDCVIKNAGSGDIELSGKTNNLTASIMGSGDLDGYNLYAVNVTVSNSGSSDVSVNAIESLKVVLNGSGDLIYRGNAAKVDVKSNGSGEVYKK